jgi:hypothetical protein
MVVMQQGFFAAARFVKHYAWVLLGLSLAGNGYLVYQRAETRTDMQNHVIHQARSVSFILMDVRLVLQAAQQEGWQDPAMLHAIADDLQEVWLKSSAALDMVQMGAMWDRPQSATIRDMTSRRPDFSREASTLQDEAQNLYTGNPLDREALNAIARKHDVANFPNPNDVEEDAAFMRELCSALERYRTEDYRQRVHAIDADDYLTSCFQLYQANGN